MKSTVESSVFSHSQSEGSSQIGKSQLLHGTTTKIDSIFPFLDQVSIKSHVPTIIYYLSTVYLYYQIFFSSFYPFNKFWYIVNADKNYFLKNRNIVKINSVLEQIAWFFHVENTSSNEGRTNEETNLLPPALIMIVIFVISMFNICIQMFGLTRLHRLRKINFYLIRFILDIISPIMIIPTSALVGISIRNLVTSNDKLNWIYLFLGAVMYFIFLLYTYIGLMVMNQSTCISLNLLSSFNIKIPLLLPVVASLFVILQCIFSLFNYWAMIIVQLSHVAVCIFAFYPLVYLIFHTKIANIMFISVILSTCFNDLIFFILHFVNPPSKNDSVHEKMHFFYLSGFIFPLLFLVISNVISAFFVNSRLNFILNELNQLSDQDDSRFEIDNNNNENNNDNFDFNNSKFNDLSSHKLFHNENSALMSIHVSFFHCLPIFYKWTALSYIVSQIPTNNILISAAQYLSFFPGSSRKLNKLLSIISQNRDLKYHQRFLLYQIFGIKTKRQSSVSADANRRLTELKAITTQNYDDIISFYQLKSSNAAYLEMISNENWTVDGKWEEAVRDYPNYQKFCDEYCSFLIECEMNLPRALVMKHRSNLIEMGKNFNVDVPFISLAKNVPYYLKKDIVDFQGNFKRQKDLTKSGVFASSGNQNVSSGNQIQKASSSSGSSGSNGSTGMFSSASSMLSNGYNLDPEFEETLGHQLFKKTQLRLEMYRSLANRKSYASLLILIYSFFILFGGIALLTGIYFYIDGYIIDRSDSMYYLNLASKIRFYLDLSILGSTLKYAYFTGRFNTLNEFNDLDKHDDIDELIATGNSTGYDADSFKIDDQISYTLIHSNLLVSKDTLSQFIIHLALLSFDGEPVYDLALIFMYNEIPFTMCINGIPDYDVPLSLKTLIAYMHFLVDQTSSKEPKEDQWFNTDDICEILSNQPQIESSTLVLFSTLINHEIDLCDKEDKFIAVFSTVFPFIPLILYIVPPLVFQYLFIKDTNKVVKILLGLNPDAKEEAKMPVRKDSMFESSQVSEKKPKCKQWIILKVALIIFSVATTVLVYFLLSETKELNNDVKKLGRWNLLSSIRMSSSVVSMNYMLTAVMLNGSSSLNLTSSPKAIATRENMIKFCKETLVQLENSNEVLLKGNEDAMPSSGFDHQLDEINLNPKCEISKNNTNLHDSYRCASGSQGVNIFISMINVILDDIEKTGGNFEHEMIYHSLHLLNRHLLGKLELAVDRIHEINVILCKELEKKSMIIFVCAVITTILTFVILLLFYIKSVKIYQFGMVLIQRIPPNAFLSDKKLRNFILNKKENKKESEMSTSQSVIYMSLDAIICTNGSGVIEIINPAVSSILGYTPDQMLGQHISTFFANYKTQKDTKQNENAKDADPNNTNPNTQINNDNILQSDSERLTKQLELMINGQSGLVFEGHFNCMTDDDKEMPCGLTILGMTGKGQTTENNEESHHEIDVESFVVILRDETQLIEQQQEAEEAKARSENLLFHILPRDIVSRINSGEKDVSFTVQSASIIFTDVVKFSEYASSLSPQEIMGSLSLLFAAFDSCAKNYNLITKIKLIGDIYMAAAGLFSADISPKDHAEQILNFGIDCLNELDDVNLKLNASLQLRIGINSGGPILAGVLGTDKPVFDIIGDPINVAARLQTTDCPGKIQIPKETYDLVCDGDFAIEERGEVFLKGKGKTMAYLVSPQHQNNVPFMAVSSQKLE